MSHTLFCQFDSDYSSARERSISLCECANAKSSSSEFNENDEVEQGTVKLEMKTESPLWERILQEFEDNMTPHIQWWKEKLSQETTSFFREGPSDYLNKNIFPILLPVLTDMLIQARQKNAVKGFKNVRFNGIDFLAEKLWNQNPRHPERLVKALNVFNIPPFKNSLKIRPRPVYPKSLIWTEDEAAMIIQKHIRGWLVRKRDIFKAFA